MFKPYTPAIRMQRTAVLRKAQPWFDEVGQDFEVSGDEVYLALLDFVNLSLRMNGSKPKVDFKWLAPSDDSATIRKKFEAYLNTKTAAVVWQLETELRTFDAPVDSELAPEAPTDPEA
jgi:hypothetical protein